MSTNMTRGIIGILAIFFILSSFFLRRAGAVEFSASINIKADYLEYQKENNLIYGRGNVSVTSEDMILQSDELFVNTVEERLTARGKVSGHDKSQNFKGEEVTYNLQTKQASLTNGQINAYHWLISGPLMRREGPEKMSMDAGSFTTCDLEHPHYRIKAKGITVYPKRYLVCHNAFFVLDDLPVLYFPFYYQSLKKKKYSLNVNVGHNSTEGDFVKVIYGYPLTDHTYGRLYLDYMKFIGWGKGVKYEYDLPDLVNGSLYYYYVHQRKRDVLPILPEAKRRNITVYHWQKFDQTWIGQANVRVLSDQTFNQRFNEEYRKLVSNDITSYLSLSKSTTNYTFRVLGERRDLWNTTTESFKPDYIYAPRLTLSTYQLRLPSISRRIPLYYNFNVEAKRGYTQSQGFYLWDGNTDFSLTSRLSPFYPVSIVPRVGLTEIWQDKINLSDVRDLYRTQYFTSVNMRTALSRFFDWDIGHDYREEIQAFPLEKRGVVNNRLNTVLELRFSRTGLIPEQKEYAWKKGKSSVYPEAQAAVDLDLLKSELGLYRQKHLAPRREQRYYRKQLLRIRSSIGYNLIHNGYFPVDRKERFENLINTLYLTPTNWASFEVIEEYSVLKKANQRLTTDFRFWKNKWDIAILSTYLKSDSDKLDVQNDLGFWLTSNWKINFHTRYVLSNDHLRIMRTNLTERSVLLYRDLHCWEVQFSWRKLPQEEEAWIRFNLKAFPERKLGVYHAQRINGQLKEEEWNIRRK